MADSPAFDLACDVLEQSSTLDRLEARGTIRLALKQAGLDARDVQPDQMATVVAKILPAELTTRGIDDAESVCSELGRQLDGLESMPVVDSPEAVFQRLGG